MRTRLSASVLVLAFSALGVSDAHALANRVFVSARSGNNANSCDNLLTPCQTLAGAVVQLNAGGEAIVLDSGGYGPVTITKSLTIEAPPGVTAFVHPPSGDAITIAAGASAVVVLRGLVLNGGTGNGIKATSAGVLHVESCVISGFGNIGVHFNTPGALLMKDVIVRGNLTGVYVDPSSGTATVSADRCRIEANIFGFYCSAVGGATAKGSIRDSTVSDNSNIGLSAEAREAGGAGELNVESCLITENFIGAISQAAPGGTATLRLSNSTVTDNTSFGVSGPGTLLTRGNNTVEGNGNDNSMTPYAAK